MPTINRGRGNKADATAILLSSFCLVHCLALPIMIAMAPAFVHLANWPEWTHRLLVALAVPASAYAVHRGFRLHRQYAPMLLAALGLLVLALPAFGGVPHQWEIGMTVVGSLVLVAAHVTNLRWRAA